MPEQTYATAEAAQAEIIRLQRELKQVTAERDGAYKACEMLRDFIKAEPAPLPQPKRRWRRDSSTVVIVAYFGLMAVVTVAGIIANTLGAK